MKCIVFLTVAIFTTIFAHTMKDSLRLYEITAGNIWHYGIARVFLPILWQNKLEKILRPGATGYFLEKAWKYTVIQSDFIGSFNNLARFGLVGTYHLTPAHLNTVTHVVELQAQYVNIRSDRYERAQDQRDQTFYLQAAKVKISPFLAPPLVDTCKPD